MSTTSPTANAPTAGARRWSTAVAVLGVVAASATLVLRPAGELGAEQVGLLVVLTAALVATAALPISLDHQQHRVTLEEAVLVAMLVTVPVGVIAWLAVLATVLHELHRRTERTKLLFNAGAAALGAAAAVGVFVALADLREDGLLTTLAVAAAAAAVAVVVQLLVIAGLFAAMGRGSFRSHLDIPGVLDLALALNLLLGVLLASAIVAEPWLVLAALGLVVLLGLVLRSQRPDPA